MKALKQAVVVIGALCGALAGGLSVVAAEPTWQRVGQRWALERDGAGRGAVLHDLSFPDFSGRSRLRLGALDISDQAFERVRSLIESGGRGVPGASEAVQALETVRATPLPARWWRAVPWKDQALARGREGPARFKVSDILIERAVKNPAEVARILRKLEALPELGVDFLDRFEFVRSPEGAYEIFYNGNGKSSATGYRLANLRRPTERMWVAIRWNIAEAVVGLVIGQVTHPFLGPLIGTASSRFFLHRRELLRLHEERVFEALNAAEQGEGPVSPLMVLSPAERVALARSLVLGQSTWITALRWYLRKPENEWRRSLRKDSARSRTALAWLVSRNEAIEELNPRFVRATDRGGWQRLVLLPRSGSQRSAQPHVAVDYRDPEARTRSRRSIELAGTLVDFASRFVPYAGFLVSEAFYALVEKPVRVSQGWEARLASHLEERDAAAGQSDWSWELEILERQRFNPLEIPRAAALELADRRWAELGARLVP